MKIKQLSMYQIVKLLNLMAATALLFFLGAARTTQADQVKVLSDGRLELEKEELFKSYLNLGEFIKGCIRLPDGEVIDRERCDAKVPAPSSRRKTTFISMLGFKMIAPEPSPFLNELIQNISVSFIGSATENKKMQQVAMLKKVLPMVGNYQLLARALANTEFLLDYTASATTLNAGLSYGKCGRSMQVILSGHYTFYDESFLLSFLKNEFASVNMVITNDCSLGVYNNSLPRSSPFLFYHNGSQSVLNTEPKTKLQSRAQDNVVKATFKDFNDFIAAGERLAAMCKGMEPKSDRYQQLETLLKDYIPIPFTEAVELNSPDMFITAENERPDAVFDVYLRNVPNTAYQVVMYLVRGSGIKMGNRMQFTAYEDDPRTMYGKLIGLRRQLIGERSMALEGNSESYANKPQLEQLSEWFSFLEELPHPLLEFLFPTYCDYMTKYTKLDQDNRSYCGF